jgi:hypothetical protein
VITACFISGLGFIDIRSMTTALVVIPYQDSCIALGWRFVNWPLPITATRTTTRSENRTRGSRDQRNHQRVGTRAQGVSSQYKGPQPFFQEGQVRRNRVQPPPPLPPPQGSLGRDPLPPSTELPLPPENYHLGLTSVKTSFRPPNLGQKSRFGHKTTEWSISG